MTILISKEGLEMLSEKLSRKLSYPLIVFDNKKDMISKALKLIDSGSPVLLISKDAWNDWNYIKKEILKSGLNRFLIDIVDSIEFELVKDLIDPIGLVIAKYTALLNFMSHKALYITNPEKPVDRRTLILRPHTALLEYVPAPILLSPESCSKWKYCNACIDSCPYNALEGKPPTIKPEMCTGCGVCVASCPFGLLYMPQYNLKSFELFLSSIRSRIGLEPAWIIAVCRDSLVEIRERIKNGSFSPAFFVPIECPGWFDQFHMISAILQGFQPIIYCDKETSGKCGGLEIVESWSKELSEIVNIPVTTNFSVVERTLSKKPNVKVIERAPMLYQNRVAALSLFRTYNLKKAEFSAPLVGLVDVSNEKCMVCDACSNMCPFQALRVRNEGDRRNLEFNMSRCTACGICEAICPYGAIKVGYKYNKEYDKEWKVVASDQIAKCRRCGKPIGSMKYLRYLEKKLKESGADSWVLESLWLCQECKIKALIERQMLGDKEGNN